MPVKKWYARKDKRTKYGILTKRTRLLELDIPRYILGERQYKALSQEERTAWIELTPEMVEERGWKGWLMWMGVRKKEYQRQERA